MTASALRSHMKVKLSDPPANSLASLAVQSRPPWDITQAMTSHA